MIIEPTTQFNTIDEWIPHMDKDTQEYVQFTDLSLADWNKWRDDTWSRVYQEMHKNTINVFQEYLEYPHYLRETMQNLSATCISEIEIKEWITERIQELTEHYESTGEETYWDNVVDNPPVYPIDLNQSQYAFIKTWHNTYQADPGDYNEAARLSVGYGLTIRKLGALNLITYETNELRAQVQLTELAIVSMEAKDTDILYARKLNRGTA